MFCRSSTHTREDKIGPKLLTALFALAIGIVSARGATLRADDALDDRARDVLAAHCAACSESGGGPPLDLTAIARDPNLVRPGNPDGSPAYTALLRRIGITAGPSADELRALRAWIESLPAEAATCPTASFVARERIEAELARVAAKLRKPVAALRVLTFAHLDLGCASATELQDWRRALGFVLAAAAGMAHPAPTVALDADSRILAVDIQDLGWDASRWRGLTGATAGARRSDEPLIVRADMLAARILAGKTDLFAARSMFAAGAPSESQERHANVALWLARHHLAPLGIAHVAAELGMKPDALEHAMTTAEIGDRRQLLLRLLYGTLARSEIESKWTLLAGAARVPPPAHAPSSDPAAEPSPAATSDTAIELEIVPDRRHYAAGDPISLHIRANLDCYLTVISIDTAGFGTVIFPNDFQTGNRMSAHVGVTLPPPGSRYRFRVKDKGRERIAALCTRNEGSVDGIRHDFERQRFQELGPYAAFLDKALRQAAGQEEERTTREGTPPVPQSEIWRTGIVIDVR